MSLTASEKPAKPVAACRGGGDQGRIVDLVSCAKHRCVGVVEMPNQVPPEILPTPEIRNREEFLHVLARTSAEMDNFVAREPAYPVWPLLQRQLHAMQEWTAYGASPNEFQRSKIS